MFYTEEVTWKTNWRRIDDALKDIFGEDADGLKKVISQMEDDLDDGCMDNFRIAIVGDEEAEKAYEEAYEEAKGNGCCGYEDRIVDVNGRSYKIGCNYGH